MSTAYTGTLCNKCVKNCCKQTILVQVIIEDVVTLFGTQSRQDEKNDNRTVGQCNPSTV